MQKVVEKIEYSKNSNLDDFSLLMDIGGTAFRSVLMDRDYRIKPGSLNIQNIYHKLKTQEELADLIANRIIEHIKNGSKQREYIISLAGDITRDCKTIKFTPNILPGWKDIPMAELVLERVRKITDDVEFSMMGDGPSGSIAEMTCGAAMDYDHAVGLIVGTGLGGTDAIRENGKVKPGFNIVEPGHYHLDEAHTFQCNCGKIGCVETQVSGEYMGNIANKMYIENKEKYKDSMLAEDVAQCYLNGKLLKKALDVGDKFAFDILDKTTNSLSRLTNKLLTEYPDLHIILVGGLSINIGQIYLDSLKKHMVERGLFGYKKEELPEFLDKRIKLGIVPQEITNFIGTFSLLKE